VIFLLAVPLPAENMTTTVDHLSVERLQRSVIALGAMEWLEAHSL
jgi:hypothetical protein